MLRLKGPLIIAANHPNSFLDAIILATLMKSPIYSLARGDAFAGKIITKILESFNMLPVYRISEGAENLETNYSTFDECQNLLKQNKTVLIFSEGSCVNEWKLRPLKKGTARLALTAWQHNIPLKVLPVGINYSSFRKYGKILILNFGSLINQSEMYEDLSSGKAINEFNEKLKSQLNSLVYEIKNDEQKKLENIFNNKPALLKKIILLFPSLIGFILHAPLYSAIDLFIKKKANDHYDSIMTGLLFLLYPAYILITVFAIFFITNSLYSFTLLILFPASALSYLHFKNLFSKPKDS